MTEQKRCSEENGLGAQSEEARLRRPHGRHQRGLGGKGGIVDHGTMDLTGVDCSQSWLCSLNRLPSFLSPLTDGVARGSHSCPCAIRCWVERLLNFGPNDPAKHHNSITHAGQAQARPACHPTLALLSYPNPLQQRWPIVCPALSTS